MQRSTPSLSGLLVLALLSDSCASLAAPPVNRFYSSSARFMSQAVTVPSSWFIDNTFPPQASAVHERVTQATQKPYGSSVSARGVLEAMEGASYVTATPQRRMELADQLIPGEQSTSNDFKQAFRTFPDDLTFTQRLLRSHRWLWYWNDSPQRILQDAKTFYGGDTSLERWIALERVKYVVVREVPRSQKILDPKTFLRVRAASKIEGNTWIIYTEENNAVGLFHEIYETLHGAYDPTITDAQVRAGLPNTLAALAETGFSHSIISDRAQSQAGEMFKLQDIDRGLKFDRFTDGTLRAMTSIDKKLSPIMDPNQPDLNAYRRIYALDHAGKLASFMRQSFHAYLAAIGLEVVVPSVSPEGVDFQEWARYYAMTEPSIGGALLQLIYATVYLKARILLDDSHVILNGNDFQVFVDLATNDINGLAWLNRYRHNHPDVHYVSHIMAQRGDVPPIHLLISLLQDEALVFAPSPLAEASMRQAYAVLQDNIVNMRREGDIWRDIGAKQNPSYDQLLLKPGLSRREIAIRLNERVKIGIKDVEVVHPVTRESHNVPISRLQEMLFQYPDLIKAYDLQFPVQYTLFLWNPNGSRQGNPQRLFMPAFLFLLGGVTLSGLDDKTVPIWVVLAVLVLRLAPIVVEKILSLLHFDGDRLTLSNYRTRLAA